MPRAVGARAESSARHYLKFMLPSIPITMFVLGFVYCSLLVGARATSPTAPAAARTASGDPALPLVGALLLALTSGLLCVLIYQGYLRVAAQSAAHEG